MMLSAEINYLIVEDSVPGAFFKVSKAQTEQVAISNGGPRARGLQLTDRGPCSAVLRRQFVADRYRARLTAPAAGGTNSESADDFPFPDPLAVPTEAVQASTRYGTPSSLAGKRSKTNDAISWVSPASQSVQVNGAYVLEKLRRRTDRLRKLVQYTQTEEKLYGFNPQARVQSEPLNKRNADEGDDSEAGGGDNTFATIIAATGHGTINDATAAAATSMLVNISTASTREYDSFARRSRLLGFVSSNSTNMNGVVSTGSSQTAQPISTPTPAAPTSASSTSMSSRVSSARAARTSNNANGEANSKAKSEVLSEAKQKQQQPTSPTKAIPTHSYPATLINAALRRSISNCPSGKEGVSTKRLSNCAVTNTNLKQDSAPAPLPTPVRMGSLISEQEFVSEASTMQQITNSESDSTPTPLMVVGTCNNNNSEVIETRPEHGSASRNSSKIAIASSTSTIALASSPPSNMGFKSVQGAAPLASVTVVGAGSKNGNGNKAYRVQQINGTMGQGNRVKSGSPKRRPLFAAFSIEHGIIGNRVPGWVSIASSDCLSNSINIPPPCLPQSPGGPGIWSQVVSLTPPETIPSPSPPLKTTQSNTALNEEIALSIRSESSSSSSISSLVSSVVDAAKKNFEEKSLPCPFRLGTKSDISGLENHHSEPPSKLVGPILLNAVTVEKPLEGRGRVKSASASARRRSTNGNSQRNDIMPGKSVVESRTTKRQQVEQSEQATTPGVAHVDTPDVASVPLLSTTQLASKQSTWTSSSSSSKSVPLHSIATPTPTNRPLPFGVVHRHHHHHRHRHHSNRGHQRRHEHSIENTVEHLYSHENEDVTAVDVEPEQTVLPPLARVSRQEQHNRHDFDQSGEDKQQQLSRNRSSNPSQSSRAAALSSRIAAAVNALGRSSSPVVPISSNMAMAGAMSNRQPLPISSVVVWSSADFNRFIVSGDLLLENSHAVQHV